MFNSKPNYLAYTQLILVGLLIGQQTLYAQKYKKDVIQNLDNKQKEYGEIAHQIWEWAEVGYQETKSSSLLQGYLKRKDSQ